MNFKQHYNGLIEASFTPEELPALVRLVKGSEQMRLEGIKAEAAKSLAKAEEAEKLLAQDPSPTA